MISNQDIAREKINDLNSASTVSEFANVVLEEINSLPRNNKLIDVLVFIDSRIAIKKLITFLENLKSSNKRIFLNLNLLCNVLNDYWFSIRDFDSSYFHHPETDANLAFYIFAKHLSHIVNIPIHELLMSSMPGIDCDAFSFKKYIRSDIGIAINVQQCLDTAFNNHTFVLFHTYGSKLPLSPEDATRVINHSPEARKYYDALKDHIIYSNKEALIQAREEFLIAMQHDDYDIHATYGSERRKKHAKRLLSDIKNQKEFVTFLSQEVPKERWKEFISQISSEDLTRLILESDAWINVLQRKSTYQQNENYNKAILFCLSEVYWRERQHKGKYTSTMGWLADYSLNYLIKVPDKDDKKEELNLIQAFLMSDEPLSAIDNYLERESMRSQKGMMLDFCSHLSLMINQIRLISTPDYFQEKSTSVWQYFGLS